jgi:hypothetical protein
MLLYIYNDYIFTLLGCNSLLPIENKERFGKDLQAVVQATSDIDTKQRRVDHLSPQPGQRETRSEQKLGLK